MTKSHITKLLVGLGIAAITTAAACNGDVDEPPQVAESNQEEGTGGQTPVNNDGGTDPTGGGQGGEAPADCPGEIVYDDLSFLQPCPSYMCGGGAHCVPNALLADQDPETLQYLQQCNSESYCVPDVIIETEGNFLLDECTAVMGLEGRCMNTCIPEVAAQAGLLTQDVCGDHDVCVPCFDPFSLEPTGVCTFTCDPGPVDGPPDALPTCCGDDSGTCIPNEVLPPEASGAVGQDSCDAGNACVPTEMLDPTWYGEPCAPDILLQLLGVDDGACLPECLPAVDGIGAGSCPSGYKCAPCDALGESTGACGEPPW